MTCKLISFVLKYLSYTDKCPSMIDKTKAKHIRPIETGGTYGRISLLCRKEAGCTGSITESIGSEKAAGNRAGSLNEAADQLGISRSSFYKYKDDIFQFHDNAQGTTITLAFQMDDEPGLLSDVLKIIAEYQANILPIHQSIPINGVASLTLSVQVLPDTGDISRMIEIMESRRGVRNVSILAKE